MSEFRAIEIDFEVHKRIEVERQSFSETPNEVLRRLLGLCERQPVRAASPPPGRPWMGARVVLPHGTEIRMSYNGRQYEGQILDGQWIVEGQAFRSPSGAAGGVAETKSGGKTKLDGWNYWKAKVPGGSTWRSIKAMRRTGRAGDTVSPESVGL